MSVWREGRLRELYLLTTTPGCKYCSFSILLDLGWKTALLGLQQVLSQGLAGPWEGSARKHLQLLGPDGLTYVSLCQAKMACFPLFGEQGLAGSQIWPFQRLGSVLGVEWVR